MGLDHANFKLNLPSYPKSYDNVFKATFAPIICLPVK